MKFSFPWWQRGATAKAGRVGLTVGPQGLELAQVDVAGHLLLCEYHPCEDDTVQQLRGLVERHQLQDLPCSIVLHPDFYQLLLTEAPAVASEELSQAVRWKVKELLDFPLDQAAVESFLLPDDAYRGRQKMLYAAALKKQALNDLVTPVEEAGLAVDCVEIAELAMHKLVARLPVEPGGVALVHLHQSGGFINLVEEGDIYLSRRLDVGLQGFDPVADNTAFFDALYLDIQRSLDFYEAQLGKGIITQLWYSPGLPSTAEIGNYLSSQLGLNVSALDLSPLKLIDVIDEELDEHISQCAAAIGAALGTADAKAIKESLSAAS